MTVFQSRSIDRIEYRIGMHPYGSCNVWLGNATTVRIRSELRMLIPALTKQSVNKSFIIGQPHETLHVETELTRNADRYDYKEILPREQLIRFNNWLSETPYSMWSSNNIYRY